MSEFAVRKDVTYMTAWRWFRDGKLPVRSEQMPSGTIIVFPDEPVGGGRVTIYARVASEGRSEDLGRQAARLKDYASGNGWTVVSVVDEVGSSLNGRRKKLLKLLSDPAVGVILVEHRDRLARFGVEYIEAALVSQGRSIVVADETEEMADIWQDLTDMLTGMCERIFGGRAAKAVAAKALAAVRSSGETSRGCK